jgi:hypothetical protein
MGRCRSCLFRKTDTRFYRVMVSIGNRVEVPASVPKSFLVRQVSEIRDAKSATGEQVRPRVLGELYSSVPSIVRVSTGFFPTVRLGLRGGLEVVSVLNKSDSLCVLPLSSAVGKDPINKGQNLPTVRDVHPNFLMLVYRKEGAGDSPRNLPRTAARG